jgi:glucose-6-phosphate isomerase
MGVGQANSMTDLTKISGLPLKINNQFKLEFGSPELCVEPAVRKASDMKEVILDYKPAISKQELYYMYRNVAFEKDKKRIKQNNLRYDITVMLPISLGREFNKTKGHYHPKIIDQTITYPEVYEVLSGWAWYLIQKPIDGDYSKIEKNFLIKAKIGEKVVIPPGYGHVTINPDLKKPLVMSNWVSSKFESEYSQYLKQRGGSYYFIKSDNSDYELVKNDNYSALPGLKVIFPKDLPEFGLSLDFPAYELVKKNIKLLDFLNNPSKYDLNINSIYYE